MSEQFFEHFLGKIIKSRGGEYHKITYTSWPDRIITFPGVPPIYVEIKKNGKVYGPSNKQRRQIERLSAKGFEAHLIDANDNGQQFLMELIDGILKKR